MRADRALRFAALLLAGCGSNPPSEAAHVAQPDAGLVDAPVKDVAVEADAAPEGGTPFAGPKKLSETGLDGQDVLAYDVRYPLWSDGAEKQRWLLLPPGTQIDTSAMDVWKFPIGTKAWKEFRVGGKLVETRMLWKQAEAVEGWLKVAYVWNDAGTEALAAPDGVADVAGTKHDVPSIEQCEQCHNGAGDVLIGVAALQLGKEGGGGTLSKLASAGRLSQPPAAEPDVPGTGVVKDALGYLHGNCGHCHNDESFLATKRALRLKLLTGAATPEETPTYKTTLGAPAAHDLYGTTLIVTPSAPDTSQLLARMKVRNLDQMPPAGTEVVDTAAVDTITSWILGLK